MKSDNVTKGKIKPGIKLDGINWGVNYYEPALVVWLRDGGPYLFMKLHYVIITVLLILMLL